MKYHPQFHDRKSVRLRTKDYRSGSYFITICAVNREWLFGDIKGGGMMLNELGKIVEKCWHEIPKHFSHVSLDTFIVMPNHIHGILTLNTSGRGIAPVQDHEGRGIACNAPTDAVIMKANEIPSSPQIFGKSSPGTLPVIVRAFKSATTRHINRLRNSPATPIWQRNYYEHAIRNNEELQKIRMYIQDNPKHWFTDEEYSPPYSS